MSRNTANNPSLHWHEARVMRGEQQGRKIGFPTLNLDNVASMKSYRKGIYAARVVLDGMMYCGALYFGPRLVFGETHDVLEIHLLDFSLNVYEKTVQFAVLAFIRDVEDFPSLDALKIQMQDDCAGVQFVCLCDRAK